MALNTEALVLEPFDVRYADLVEVASDLAHNAVFAVNEPPWSSLQDKIAPPAQIMIAKSMEESDLVTAAKLVSDAVEVAVGIGGGTAIDMAKYLSWSRDIPLILLPTIASVDASFTDAVGVRRDRKVVYVGNVRPREVILDLPLIASAPARLNRAGIGDILSCHTGLFDWQLAVRDGQGVQCNQDLAVLGSRLLDELEETVEDIREVTQTGVKFLMDAYRRIGAACAAAGHSRFEEGSEHFLGYALEQETGHHFIHGELISMCVIAMSSVQGNDVERALRIINSVGTLSHPDAVGVSLETVHHNIMRLSSYVKSEGLDYCCVNATPVSLEAADKACELLLTLPGGKNSS